MPQEDSWSWIKFLKGPFVGKNYAKAVVNLICMAVILTICYSVYTVIKTRFGGPKPISQTESFPQNQGVINKTDSHDSTEKKGWQLFGGIVQVNT